MKARLLIAASIASLMLAGTPARALTVYTSVPIGPGAALVAVNPIKDLVYATAFGKPGPGGDVVSVIDVAGPTPAVIGTIPVGVDPYGIDVNILTSKIYVANFGSGSVSVLDESTAPPSVKTIPGMPGAAGVAVNPVLNRVYVMSTTGVMHTIDGFTDTVVSSLPVAPASKGAFLIELNPVLQRIYVPESGGDALHVVNALTGTKIAAVPLPPLSPFPSGLGGVAVHPITQDVYVTYEKGGLYRLDGLTHAIKATTPVGIPGSLPYGTWGVEVNVLTGHAYVAQFHTNTVFAFDASTLAFAGSVATGPVPVPSHPTSGPHFTALNPLSGVLYVTNELAGSVSVISDP